MKRSLHVLLIACCVLGLTSGTALAKRKSGPTYVPPSQSAASQYTEDVPTAGGNTPTSRIGGGGSGGSSGASGSGAIPAKTLHQLDHRGSAGAAAASLAQSLAPAAPHAPTRAPASSPHASASPTSPAARAGAPASQVIKTLGGADAGSGIGFLLPLILVLSLVGATGLGLLRIRRTA